MSKVISSCKPEVVYLDACEYSICPADAIYNREANSAWYASLDEAFDEAKQWSVELHGKRVYVYHKDKQVAYCEA